MQHSITLLLGQIAIKKPGGMACHCPVEHFFYSHLAQTRWDGVLLQNAVVAMLVKCDLNSK
jgi:hypothetical protein